LSTGKPIDRTLRFGLLRGVLAGCAALLLAAMTADSTTVVQQHRAFSIDHISLQRGATLHFSNEDDFTHEIYIETPQFNFESDEQEPGTVVTVTFTSTGHFPVRCHIHPKMHLDVDVQ
jgi:plastocyanin